MKGANLRGFVETTPSAAAMFDLDMKCIAASPRWRADFQSNYAASNVSHCDVSDRLREKFERVLADDVAASAEDCFEAADGSVRRIRWQASPWRGDDGAVCGTVVFAEDVTLRRQPENTLRECEAGAREQLEELGWIYQNAPVGLCSVDRDLRFRRVNPWLAEITGLPVEAHIGRAVREIIPALAPKVEAFTHTNISTGKPLTEFEFQSEARLQPGVMRYFKGSCHPVIDNDGDFVGFNVIVEEITESRRARALREADRRKDDFLATLAHELRNLIAPIGNAVTLLRLTEGDDPKASERRHDALSRADRQINHLTRLVDDLLDVTRISHGKMHLKKERTDLATVLCQAIDISQPRLQAGRDQLRINISPRPMPIDGDTVRLAQAFANLLTNAAKFTDDGGCIDLVATIEGAETVVSVRDNGIGIPPEKLSAIFEMFAQLDCGAHGRADGIGVGLALAREIVELHGGQVEARSGGLGQGSEFIIRLPLAVDRRVDQMVA